MGKAAGAFRLPPSAHMLANQASALVLSFVVPSMLFEDVTLKPRSTETEKLPLSKPPFFDK
jgi:hypothetical protein